MLITTPDAAEFPLIYDSWSLSYRKSPWAGTVPNSLWERVSRETMRAIIDRGALVLVAVTPIEGGEGRRVAGYSVSEPDRKILHWIFVKKDFRDLGIGAALRAKTCPGSGWEYTHRTRSSSKFLGPDFKWNPVAARLS